MGSKGETKGSQKGRQGNAPCIVVHCNLCPYMQRMPETFE
jgi:hypothetical protein